MEGKFLSLDNVLGQLLRKISRICTKFLVIQFLLKGVPSKRVKRCVWFGIRWARILLKVSIGQKRLHFSSGIAFSVTRCHGVERVLVFESNTHNWRRSTWSSKTGRILTFRNHRSHASLMRSANQYARMKQSKRCWGSTSLNCCCRTKLRKVFISSHSRKIEPSVSSSKCFPSDINTSRTLEKEPQKSTGLFGRCLKKKAKAVKFARIVWNLTLVILYWENLISVSSVSLFRWIRSTRFSRRSDLPSW